MKKTKRDRRKIGQTLLGLTQRNTEKIRILLRFLIILSTAVLIMFFVEWRFFGNDFGRAAEFAFLESPRVFFYNVLLLFFIELIIAGLFRAAWTGAGVTFILAIIISYVNVSKYNFRGQPLLPEDFMLADQTGTLTKFIDFGSLIRTILACLIAVELTLLLNRLSRRLFKKKETEEGFLRKNLRYLRIIMVVVGVLGFIFGTDFVRNRSGERNVEIDWLDTTLVAWNQQLNYEKNGFILGFMYNWNKFEVAEPEGYSKEKISEIKEKYATEEEPDKVKLEDLDVNIVTVLNESFFDPNVLSEYYPYSRNSELSENSMGVPVTNDVIPTVRSLISKDKKSKYFATGQMYSTDYGGGTANIEFEVDTAMTNFWVNTVPYVDLLPHIDSVPSMASFAKEAGYDTVAIHPFNGGMYKRNIALSKEGFDQFITEDEMEFKEQDDNRQYINDRSAYKETLKILEEYEEKTYVSLITMQNHAGYGGEDYSTRSYILSEAPKTGEDRSPFSEDEKNMVEIYLETLHNSDLFTFTWQTHR